MRRKISPLYNSSDFSPVRFLLPSFVALGIWLGFPNDFISFPPLVLLWPAGVTLLGVRAANVRQAFFSAWLAGFMGTFAALYWLCLPLRVVGQLPWPFAIACAAFISAILSLQSGIIAVCSKYLARFSIFIIAPAIAIIWYLLEYAFAVALGFPWLPVAGALIVWPVLMQHTDCLGAYLAGSIWICATILALPGIWGRKSAVFTGALLACAIIVYGQIRLVQSRDASSPEPSINAIFIEGNVDQNQKWLPTFQKWTLDLYLDLTEKSLAEAARQGWRQPLIIWPETALPFFFEKTPQLAARIIRAVKAFDSPLLFGAPGVSHTPGQIEDAVFNRAFLLGPDGSILGQYDKEHLVPFGEYLPSWLDFNFLKALTQGVGIYQQGQDSRPLKYGSLALGLLICYEGIFPWLAEERVNAGANILVDISNDGWFGTTPASRQHLYLTTLRCLEQNRWLMRSTNTGISAVVDTRGRIVMAGRQFQRGFLLAKARLVQSRSIYNKIANWLPAVSLIVFCMLIFIGNVINKHRGLRHAAF